MVTFHEIDSDEEKSSLTLESDLRQVESIQSNRDASKQERKRALQLLARIITGQSAQELNQVKVLNQLVKFNCRMCHDDAEAIRQGATDNLAALIDKLNGAPIIFAGLLPTLEARLGTEQMIEGCEELRVKQLELIKHICTGYRSLLGGYLNELTMIMRRTLEDPFHAIRLISSSILLTLIEHYAINIHQYAEFFVMPLVNSLNHQQSRVRAATTNTMLKLLKISAPELLRKNLSYLVQRCFDDSPHVRRALFENVLDYMLTYRDRYSFFNLFIPILFGFFNDPDDNLAADAQTGWERCGALFERENEEDLKEELDYPRKAADHYPLGVSRPRLGCRELVGRNLLGMLGALGRDCGDNLNVDNRKMASGVLARVVQHSERVIHQHVPKVAEIVTKGAHDADQSIVANHRQIAKWLCILADGELVLKLTLPGLNGLSLGTLLIVDEFTAIHSDATMLGEVLDALDAATGHFCRDDKVLRILRQTVVNLSTKLSNTELDQRKLLNVDFFCQALVSKDVHFDDSVLQNLVYKHFTTKRDVLNELCPHLCRQLNESVKCWNVGSAEYAAWCHLLEQCCAANAQASLEVTIGTLEYLLAPSDENTRVRLQVMELLFQFASNNGKLFSPILSRLVSLVTKNVVFRAGRIECALRLLASGVLCLIIPELDGMDQLNWYKSFQDQIHSCLDDDELVTRTNVLKLIANILHNDTITFDYDFLHQKLVPLMQRLDDSSDQMRILSAQCIARLFRNLERKEPTYDIQLYGSHIEYALGPLFLHLDDNNDQLAVHLRGALDVLKQLDANRVIKTAREQLSQMKHPARAQQLL